MFWLINYPIGKLLDSIDSFGDKQHSLHNCNFFRYCEFSHLVSFCSLFQKQPNSRFSEPSTYNSLEFERLAICDPHGPTSPSKVTNLLDESFLECPKCRATYPTSRHRELLAHIDYCFAWVRRVVPSYGVSTSAHPSKQISKAGGKKLQNCCNLFNWHAVTSLSILNCRLDPFWLEIDFPMFIHLFSATKSKTVKHIFKHTGKAKNQRLF